MKKERGYGSDGRATVEEEALDKRGKKGRKVLGGYVRV